MRIVAKALQAQVSRKVDEAAHVCVTQTLVAGSNSGGGLKSRRKLPRVLRDSAALAQHITQPAGQLLARAP